MKRALLTLLMIACLLSLGACMFMGADDKEFFGKGWVNPKELDNTPSPRVPVRPIESGTPEPVGPSARSDTRATQNDTDWSTPVPYSGSY